MIGADLSYETNSGKIEAMSIIYLNNDGSIHHIEVDSTGQVYPNFCVSRNLTGPVRSIGVYTRPNAEMDEKVKLIRSIPMGDAT